jgi:hypothetical protein
MAVDDLNGLRKELPYLFKDLQVPDDWDEGWIVVPIDDPEHSLPIRDVDDYDESPEQLSAVASTGRLPDVLLPPLAGEKHPGALRKDWDLKDFKMREYPPPDAFAFYLPFHYYHPTWWGVYIVFECAEWLAKFIQGRAEEALSMAQARQVCRVFLYGHEAYHHNVEAFATRLEITHRRHLYRSAFEELYESTFLTDDCVEEALATAHGYRLVKACSSTIATSGRRHWRRCVSTSRAAREGTSVRSSSSAADFASSRRTSRKRII